MKQSVQVSETAILVGQSCKMINLICKKISDRMEPSRSVFIIHLIASQVV